MKNLAKENEFSKISLKQLFNIQIRSNKKRFLNSIASGLFIFLVITAALLTWYSYQSSAFQTYLETESKWQEDKKISCYYSTITASYTPQYTKTYVVNIVNELRNKINTLIPDLIVEEPTSAISSELYFINQSNPLLQRFELGAFDDISTEIINRNLIGGKLPENQYELIYYRETRFDETFKINDTISLKASSDPYANEQNFTVVGIVKE